MIYIEVTWNLYKKWTLEVWIDKKIMKLKSKNIKNKLYRFINMYKSAIIGYKFIVIRLKIVQVKERGKKSLKLYLKEKIKLWKGKKNEEI